ncbi:MAG TPA: pyridoxamine 5'-phosphate oxidase family protein [bacterium]|nr:pyridoxamine 5'-phosphate oxidase family protein [bacterium]
MAVPPHFPGPARPRASRPHLPASYGIASHPGRISESARHRVMGLLTGARNHWVGTTCPDGSPHAVPVWGVWLAGIFYFATSRLFRKGRNLAEDPRGWSTSRVGRPSSSLRERWWR